MNDPIAVQLTIPCSFPDSSLVAKGKSATASKSRLTAQPELSSLPTTGSIEGINVSESFSSLFFLYHRLFYKSKMVRYQWMLERTSRNPCFSVLFSSHTIYTIHHLNYCCLFFHCLYWIPTCDNTLPHIKLR